MALHLSNGRTACTFQGRQGVAGNRLGRVVGAQIGTVATVQHLRAAVDRCVLPSHWLHLDSGSVAVIEMLRGLHVHQALQLSTTASGGAYKSTL